MARFGAGRPTAHPEVYEIAPLSQEELDNFVPAEAGVETNLMTKIKDSHHRIAHLFAMGYQNVEIAEITGYSTQRLMILRKSPAMDELVAVLRREVQQVRQVEADHKFVTLNRLHALAAGELIDRFEDDEQRAKLSNGHLVSIISDTADRIGYPKRRESVNLDQSFAARLDRAIERSTKVIEGEVLPPSSSPQPQPVSPDGGGAGSADLSPQESALPVPYRRRA